MWRGGSRYSCEVDMFCDIITGGEGDSVPNCQPCVETTVDHGPVGSKREIYGPRVWRMVYWTVLSAWDYIFRLDCHIQCFHWSRDVICLCILRFTHIYPPAQKTDVGTLLPWQVWIFHQFGYGLLDCFGNCNLLHAHHRPCNPLSYNYCADNRLRQCRIRWLHDNLSIMSGKKNFTGPIKGVDEEIKTLDAKPINIQQRSRKRYIRGPGIIYPGRLRCNHMYHCFE